MHLSVCALELFKENYKYYIVFWVVDMSTRNVNF